MVELSRHAATRVCQRSVPPAVIEWLFEFGTSYPAGGGAEKLIFDKKARRRLAGNLGRLVYNRIEEFLDAYAVRSADGGVVTCGWLQTRVSK